jgi:hypothetical protein
MNYINWFLVAAGSFLVSLIACIVARFIGGIAQIAWLVSGILLNITGWVTYIIACFKR